MLWAREKSSVGISIKFVYIEIRYIAVYQQLNQHIHIHFHSIIFTSTIHINI